MIQPHIVGGQRFAAWGNCLINTWSAEVRSDQITLFDELVGKLAGQYPEGVVFFVVIEPGTPLLDNEQRKQVEAVYARWATSMRAVVQVVEGGNLWSVTIRSLMTAIRLVQRRPYPMRVFSEVSEGAAWVAEHISPPAGAGGDVGHGLRREVDQLRAFRIAS